MMMMTIMIEKSMVSLFADSQCYGSKL